MNLLYSLPDDIIGQIYKKIYTIDVMKELVHKPGNFVFLENRYINESKISWHYELEMDYKTLNILGIEAWEYIKKCEDFSIDTNKDEIYYKIYNALMKNHTSEMIFRICISHLQILSRIGWKKYKLMYTYGHN